MKIKTIIIILFLLNGCTTQESCTSIGCSPTYKQNKKTKKKKEFFSKTKKRKTKKRKEKDLFGKKILPKIK